VRQRTLFLDVDGVLAPKQYRGRDSGMVAGPIHYLAGIILFTDANVILSSAWRYMGFGRESVFGQCLRAVGGSDAQLILRATVGICPIEPDGNPVPRDALVSRYVCDHSVEHWIAIDDDETIFKLPAGRWVRPNPYLGLTEKDAHEAINLLLAMG
jgi:hypothetical protein